MQATINLDELEKALDNTPIDEDVVLRLWAALEAPGVLISGYGEVVAVLKTRQDQF
jgi:hypothetical protein